MLEGLEHEHTATFAEDEPIAVAIERAAGVPRIVVARRHRRQEDEPRQAERVDHAVDAAGEHHVGHTAADQLGRLADRLGAGRARREAREVRAPRPECGREMSGGHPRLLFGLEERVEQPDPLARESPGVDAAAIDRPADQVDEPMEVRLPLARAEVDTESRPVDLPAVEQAGIPDGLRRDRQCDLRIPAVAIPPRRVAAEVSR